MFSIITFFRILGIIIVTIPFSLLALFSMVIEKKGTLYFWSGTQWAKTILCICNISVKIYNTENIPTESNYIIVSNHSSLFDIPIIMSIFPNVRIMFKKELSYIPIWGWSIRWGHHIMIDRKKGSEAKKSLERATSDIQKGGVVLLFAEGTRTPDGKLQPFKRGAFSLAAKSAVPILPVTINGSFSILPKGSFAINPQKIEVHIAQAISTTDKKTREDEISLMKQTEEHIRFYHKEHNVKV